jgi:exopolysaccharide biosynthesis protein
LILATATGTLHQMARIMRRLGAYQAMNLDGGASSGLWAWGHYLTTPQRLLNNALLVLPGYAPRVSTSANRRR